MSAFLKVLHTACVLGMLSATSGCSTSSSRAPDITRPDRPSVASSRNARAFLDKTTGLPAGERPVLRGAATPGDGRAKLEEALATLSPTAKNLDDTTSQQLLDALQHERISPRSPKDLLTEEERTRIVHVTAILTDRAAASDSSEDCSRRASDAIRFAQDATRGGGITGYTTYALASKRAITTLARCADKTDPAKQAEAMRARASAAALARALIASAPPPVRVMLEEWSLQELDASRLDTSLACLWSGDQDKSDEERARILGDLKGWRREHFALLRDSASLAQDDQYRFLEVLLATDPAPCQPPDPLVWKIGASLSRQHELWRITERLVRENPRADTTLRDEVYNRQTRRVMERVMRLDSNAVDVGTFRGELLGDMIEVAPAGRHIGFEPLPSLHAALVERFANDRVTVHPLALGETPGKLTFTHVVSNPGYSGFREKEYDRAETTEEIEVEVETLDRMLGDAPDVDFIKIDVEGAELAVMRGAKQTICKRQPAIVFEFGAKGARAYGATPQDVWALLVEECGMKLYTLSAWLGGEGVKNSEALSLERFTTLHERDAEFYFLAID